VTGQEFSEVDFDLLADYVGGALDGTPEEAVVARRVAEEPAWAEAHAALSAATGSVRASLASWGESAEPMPAEVADRIATALEQEPRRPALSPVPDETDEPRRAVTRARRRLPAWAGPAAIAAGVAALAGFGLSQVSNLGGGSADSGSGTSAEAPAAASAEAGADTYLQRDIPWKASGLDYRMGSFANLGPQGRALSSGTPAPREQNKGQADMGAAPVLDRLKAPAALSACIDAIAQAHPLGVANVEVVDLASFEGSPAAIVFFTDHSGARWVWASGPQCGQAARGADTRGSAQIR
jgi:hypothetical protein